MQLLYGFGSKKWAAKACQVTVNGIGNRLEELNGPKQLVHALEAFARATQPGTTLQELSTRVVGQVVDFSVKDVAAAAIACRLLGSGCNPALLEALARQSIRKGWRFRARHAQAIFDACKAVGFHHPAIEELRSSVASREAAAEANVKGTGSFEKGHEDEDAGAETSTSKEEPLEDQPFFQEHRLGDRDIAAVAAAAQAWGRGDRWNREPATATREDESSAPETHHLRRANTMQRQAPGFSGDEAEQGPLKNDAELRQALKGFNRQVLRPAGLRSKSLAALSSQRRSR